MDKYICDGLCCSVLHYTGSINSWQVHVFTLVIIAITFLSAIYFMLRLRTSHENHLPVYSQFIQITCFTLLVVMVCYIIGEPKENPTLFRILYTIALAAQWWIQIAVPVFMCQKDTDKTSIKNTVVVTSIIVILLYVASISFYLSGSDRKAQYGQIIVQILLMVGFAAMVVLHVFKRYLKSKELHTTSGSLMLNGTKKSIEQTSLLEARGENSPISIGHSLSSTAHETLLFHVRPASLYWSLFQLFAHGLFMLSDTFTLYAPHGEPSKCLLIVSDLAYYFLYAPMLWYTIAADSRYWKSVGAFKRLHQKLKQTKPDLFESIEELQMIKSEEIKLEELLGIGGFAEVYKGIWHDAEVAVKKLKLGRGSEVAATNLIKEAKMLSEIRDTNVLQLMGICLEVDSFWLVTEFMSRGSVFDLLHTVQQSKNESNDPLLEKKLKDSRAFRRSWKKRLSAMIDTARGLGVLHSHNPVIIHRDIKTHNLLVNTDWQTKVADFGVSRFKEVTATFTQIGTPHWSAPEILEGHQYSEKADIYSFGIIMWELVTGRIPFEGILPSRVIVMVLQDQHKFVIPKGCYCPQRLQDLISNCCRRDPSERPAMTEALAELEQVWQETCVPSQL